MPKMKKNYTIVKREYRIVEKEYGNGEIRFFSQIRGEYEVRDEEYNWDYLSCIANSTLKGAKREIQNYKKKLIARKVVATKIHEVK